MAAGSIRELPDPVEVRLMDGFELVATASRCRAR